MSKLLSRNIKPIQQAGIIIFGILMVLMIMFGDEYINTIKQIFFS